MMKLILEIIKEPEKMADWLTDRSNNVPTTKNRKQLMQKTTDPSHTFPQHIKV